MFSKKIYILFYDVAYRIVDEIVRKEMLRLLFFHRDLVRLVSLHLLRFSEVRVG